MKIKNKTLEQLGILGYRSLERTLGNNNDT